jgi:hypothetical protein
MKAQSCHRIQGALKKIEATSGVHTHTMENCCTTSMAINTAPGMPVLCSAFRPGASTISKSCGLKMRHMQKMAPQPPEPGAADLASFGALYKYFARVNGFAYPESELRQSWESTPDGRVTKRRDSPGSAHLLTGMKKYTAIPVPVLAIFANPHGLGAWVDRNPDPAMRQAAQVYTSGLSALIEKQVKAFQNGVPAARGRPAGRAALCLSFE